MSPCVRWPPWSSRSDEDRVARLQQREVRGHVRLRAGVRLNVRVLGAEQLLRAVDRELLDLVDDLAAAVVAPARIALGVLVRRHGADRLEHARPGEVLGRDQLDLAALPLELAPEEVGDLRIDARRGRRVRSCSSVSWATAMPGPPQLRDDSMLDAPAGRAGAPRRPRRRPRAGPRGSGPVKSITVEGVPGSSPPSTTRRGSRGAPRARRRAVRGSGPPGQVRARRRDRADAREHSRAGAGELGTRTPIVSGSSPSASGSGARGSAGRA